MLDKDGRPDPDALLAAATAAETKRGRLKLFLGAAPGVGKTFEMLAQAKRRIAEGGEVLAGVIETHGRAETEAQTEGVPVLPRHSIAYRGQILQEFDLDTALKLHPPLLLMDELAHTNAPGSRHAKRWEDVSALLTAGINVWATLNVQHLESLNDDIARITGIRPSETLPDHVLELADEIELVDVPPAELRERLRSGKIYRADIAGRALEGFFKEGNLSALREIALRRTAAHVDVHMRDWMRAAGVAGPWPASDSVLALIGLDESAEAVVRQAKRLADALHAPWAALHIEQPDNHAATRHAHAPLALAAALGADIETRTTGDSDLITTLLDAARARNATHLVIGRAPAQGRRLHRAFRRTLGYHLLRRAPDFALHVVPAPSALTKRALAPKRKEIPLVPFIISSTMVAGITVAGDHFRAILPIEAADMIYLAVVVSISALWGTLPGLWTVFISILAWDFFFVPPIYRLSVNDPRDIVTAAAFLIVAILTGSLAGRVRAEAKLAGTRIQGLRRIAGFSRKLGQPANEPDLAAEVARQAANIADCAVVLTPAENELIIAAAEPIEAKFDESAWAAARWAMEHGENTGQGTSTLPSSLWRFLPLKTSRGVLGVVGVQFLQATDEARLQTLETLVDQASLAVERIRLAGESARAAAFEDTQRLRTALLASLGHDLRTPLAGIRGAAGTLRTAWDQLNEDTRTDLLASIEEDVSRMARFLANITDLTRLESGEIHPRLESISVAQVIEAAVSRLPQALHVVVRVPNDLFVLADASLLEQVFFNILDNAIKYSPDGSLVRVRAQPAGTDIQVNVIDEGVGIPPADLSNVFDSFFRVHRGDRTSPGTGLGLAIAHGLITAMGGKISATSPNPEAPSQGFPGTVISINLPKSTQPTSLSEDAQ